jgi:hypothetical protein
MALLLLGFRAYQTMNFHFGANLGKLQAGVERTRQQDREKAASIEAWIEQHILIVNYLYDLPFFKSQATLVRNLLGGWEFSGNTQFQTGQPCGVGASNDYAGVGEVGSFGCGTNTSEGQFWVRNGTPAMLKHFNPNGAGSAKYISTTNGDGSQIFTKPAAGTFNLQSRIRDQIYGPGFQNWNLFMRERFTV